MSKTKGFAMAEMKLTLEHTKYLVFELDVGEDIDGLKLVEKSGWEDVGKSQYCDIIFEYNNRFWCFSVDRSGSYHTDYYYGFVESNSGEMAHEVEKVEVVTTEWKSVKG